eukprot:TRINITY_DN4689_c2_g1_i1.p1 TRINITY_DN4689_c2_g1~~TRINITY_DN4689_c2_g1_i1.p1  ORF type:complete len:620 (-),score=231.41 TRINITY_DN4689_c2_g1_i1:784-2565(-)
MKILYLKTLFLYFLIVNLFLINESKCKTLTKKFQENEASIVYVNKIGPYSNPSETYPYYSLPFCLPSSSELSHPRASLGEALEGDFLLTSLYDIKFKAEVLQADLCTKVLTKEDIQLFKNAIDKYYYFEFILDDIPLRGFVGTTETVDGVKKYYLFKHLHFEILYNNDRIIYANVSSDLRKLFQLVDDESTPITFTYSVHWIQTKVEFNHRAEFFKDNFFEQELEIHWLSIMNSFVLVILLTGFIAIIILRVLRNDYNRYSRVRSEDDEQDGDDYGWKLIHGDVFRFPHSKNLFCAFCGIGAQFLAMAFAILFLALLGAFYPGSRGSLFTASIILYALTAGISGLVAGGFYKKMNGERWAWNVVLTTTLYVVPLFVIAAIINIIAFSFHTTSAIPFTTILVVLSIWALVGFPLTLFGSIAGRRLAGPFQAPVRTKNFAREIPPIPWYRRAPTQMLMAGFLPFSAIYIELYYIYTSVWGHNSYTLYGILFLVFIILLIVTACITIALTYFQLSMEDHRWWWRSFLSGGSTGFFIYGYSFYYYFFRSKMDGLLQAAFYFGYMFILCYFFFIMLGSVGFYSSLVFVRRIYSAAKFS